MVLRRIQGECGCRQRSPSSAFATRNRQDDPKEEVSGRKFSGYLDQFEEWSAEQMKKKYKNLNQDQFSTTRRRRLDASMERTASSSLLSLIGLKGMCGISQRGSKVLTCELYDKGYKRIGCILCPMSNPKQKRRNEDFPYVKEKWLQAIEKIGVRGQEFTRDYLGETTSGRGNSTGNQSGGSPTNPIQWEAKYWLGTATPEEVRRMAKGQ